MIKLHPGQSEVYKAIFNDISRQTEVNASRGWGKSYFLAVAGMTAVWELCELDASVPNKYVYIVAPTYSQCTDIYLPLLENELGIAKYSNKILRREGKLLFPRHVELRLTSFEAIERLRGKGAYFILMDEISSWRNAMAAIEDIIRPCINTRWSKMKAEMYGSHPGRELGISTPKGFNDFYDLYNQADRRFTFDYTKSPYLDVDELERVKRTMDPVRFATEYGAQFKESGNNIFYMFDRDTHVTSVKDNVDSEVHAAIDFNVGKQCTSLFNIEDNNMLFFGEMEGFPDTETLAISLKARFPKRKIHVYPDPTGKARKTSAKVGTTDLAILASHGLVVHARNRSPGIVDSVNAVNKQLLNTSGDVGMYFDPSCRSLIRSMERTKWVDNNANTVTIDKSDNVEHFSDGIRYATEWLFPINKPARDYRTGTSF